MHRNLHFRSSALFLALFLTSLPLFSTPSTPTVERINTVVRPISGVVTDSDTGEPLIGATVKVKGTTSGVVTDIDGNYSLDVSSGDILIVTYIGYEPVEMPVGNRAILNISLTTSASELDEIVVVGYGTAKKSDVTGSLSSIGEEELRELPVQGLDQAIQGRAAGVQVTQNSGAPGGAVSIRIRGIGSTLTAEPLYVIDGIPVVNDNSVSRSNYDGVEGSVQSSNTLNTINPNDIESIEILKDASATAIYGARGANGVVLITTKRGKKGRSRLSFESYVGRQSLARKVPVLDLREYAQYYSDIGYREIEEFEDLTLLGRGTDWQDEIFQTAFNRNAQLTLTGGSERTQFAIGGGYTRTDGIVVGSSFNRFSGKINLDHQINDRVRVGNSLIVSRTKEQITFNDNSRGVVFSALTYSPAIPVRNADGTFAAPQDEIELTFTNPVSRALETEDVNDKTRLLANLYAEIDLFPWLKYRTELGTDLLFAEQSTFQPGYVRGKLTQNSSLRIGKNENTFWINKHLLTFDKQFNESSRVNLLLGFEAQEGTYAFQFASGNDLPNNINIALNLTDAGQQTLGGGEGDFAMVSYFGRLNYWLTDRYQLTATLRADGSSRFGPNNRYGVFPSAAFAWRVNNEGFMQNFENLDNFKIRIGVGATGNQEIGLYSDRTLLRPVITVQGDEVRTVLAPSNIANPNVQWESSWQANLGIDLGFYNNRIEVIADLYTRRSDKGLLPALFPRTIGNLSVPFVNIGEIVNNGVELTINTQNTTGKLDWSTSFNFTRSVNEVLDLGPNASILTGVEGLTISATKVGETIGQHFGYEVDGIFNNLAEIQEAPFQTDDTRPGDIRFKDLDGNGVIDGGDQRIIGNPLPDFTANINNRLAYGNFDANFLFQGVFGNEILNLVRRRTDLYEGFGNQSIRALDRWTPENTETTEPRTVFFDPNNNARISDRFIEDGTFIRLKNVSIGYTLPPLLAKKIKMTSLRFYVSGQNLVTWTEYTGYDPEVGSFNQNPLINGVDNGRYPIARSYTFGLNANF